jgi:hypothetical protein
MYRKGSWVSSSDFLFGIISKDVGGQEIYQGNLSTISMLKEEWIKKLGQLIMSDKKKGLLNGFLLKP